MLIFEDVRDLVSERVKLMNNNDLLLPATNKYQNWVFVENIRNPADDALLQDFLTF